MQSADTLVAIPYQSLGQVPFGATAEIVRRVWGAPDSISKTGAGKVAEFYGAVNIGYSSDPDPQVNHFGANKDAVNIRIANIHIFGNDRTQVLTELLMLDDAYTYMGFLVFLNLGVALTGFHDQDESQRAFSMFAKGAWDHRKSKMKYFSLLS